MRKTTHRKSNDGAPMSSYEPHLARLLPRLGAVVYDAFLIVALFFIAAIAVAPFMPADYVPAGSLWFRLWLVTVMFLFFGWFWTHGGQTLGMRAWRLRVVDRRGGPITWKRALMRFLIAWPAWLSVIGLLWCLRDGRALHDQFSGTRVVRLQKA